MSQSDESLLLITHTLLAQLLWRALTDRSTIDLCKKREIKQDQCQSKEDRKKKVLVGARTTKDLLGGSTLWDNVTITFLERNNHWVSTCFTQLCWGLKKAMQRASSHLPDRWGLEIISRSLVPYMYSILASSETHGYPVSLSSRVRPCEKHSQLGVSWDILLVQKHWVCHTIDMELGPEVGDRHTLLFFTQKVDG